MSLPEKIDRPGKYRIELENGEELQLQAFTFDGKLFWRPLNILFNTEDIPMSSKVLEFEPEEIA